MPWNIFRSKTGTSRRSSPELQRSNGSPSIGSVRTEEPGRRRTRGGSRDSPSLASSRNASTLTMSEKAKALAPPLPDRRGSAGHATAAHAPERETAPKTMHRRGRSMLDPESDPLSGLNSLTQFGQHPSGTREQRVPNRRISSVHSVRSARSVRSAHSVRSGRSSSRSIKSGSFTVRSRNMKSARMAKHAMAALVASNGGQPLRCFTCQSEFSGLRCDRCRTSYLPPGFVFNAAAALNGGAAMVQPSTTAEHPVGSDNASSTASVSGVSVTGTVAYVGIVPEIEEESETTAARCIDLDLVKDLAACNDYGLLEAVVFDYFSSIDTVANTFARKHIRRGDRDDAEDEFTFDDAPDAPHSQQDANEDATLRARSSMEPTSDDHYSVFAYPEIGDDSWVDSTAVDNLYSTLASVSSTGPMRGILQGAEAILLTRRHAPVTEKELVYICVILQCPAIVECSMFTKLTGPMQKLARYSSLRSRARMLLEAFSGLVVHSNEVMRPIVVNHLMTLDPACFTNLLDLCNAYISHRLLFHFQYNSSPKSRPSRFQQVRHDWYADDWRIIVVVKFLSLMWSANEMLRVKKAGLALSAFYNTMVDQIALRDDYDSWLVNRSRKKPRFCFCQYPFLLSVGSKAKIFEHGIKREVNSEFQRELFSIMADPNRPVSLEAEQSQIAALRTLVLKVRRSNLLQDSVDQLRKWQTAKRRELRVEFYGEQGIDAGGLKREWCLMFYRELLDPKLGAFVLDETSNYCWFGKHPDIPLYRAAGIVLGLALFNSITIDFNLPLLLFKLMLDKPFNLEDVATLWPEIAQSLQSIVDYDEDHFEETFGLTFVAPDGTPLIADGDSQSVTHSTRELYVERLVGHLVDGNGRSPELQAFKDSFLEVCGCNAITLFQPEELELLVTGDRKPIDVLALRSVTKYINFGHRFSKANQEPVIQWFWDYFQKLDPQAQAKLMRFVTATDRIPAAGMVNMKFSIMCLGSDSERLPIAHTCFNQLCLYKYKTRRKFEQKLSVAVAECQGFGLK